MLDYLFTTSPSYASLTGGYSHLAPSGQRAYCIASQINELAFN